MSGDKVHLDFVALHFSTRCAAKCSFCYSADPLFEKTTPTPLPEVKRILTKLAADGVTEVLFIGGDPVVHPNFISSLEIAKSLGLTTVVLSNTWGIKPDAEFSQAVGMIDSCEATILGENAESHDAITCTPGSFSKLILNLQRIAACGKKVGVCCNAMPQNLDQIYGIVSRIQNVFQIPVRSLMIQRIIPSGGASGEFKFGLNLDDVEKLMSQIDRVATDFGIPIYFEDPVPWCTVDKKYHKYLAKCQWGYTRGSINSTGQLNRCGADDHYRLGTIWDGNIQDIWLKNPILQSFRSKAYLPDECHICDLLDKCGGGCPLSCGTLKDHDVDQLYVQRIQKDSVGSYLPSAPAGPGYTRPTVRFAYAGDLNQIVKLETLIFGITGPLFKNGNIEPLFKKCPKAFRVVACGKELMGYLVLFPLTPSGITQVRTKLSRSVLEMDINGITERFGEKVAGFYLEVIATIPNAPVKARISLIRNLLTTVQNYGLPIFACPISPAGLQLMKKSGFKSLTRHSEGSVFVKEPVCALQNQKAINE